MKIEEGYECAMKEYQRKQIFQLNALINLLLGSDLSSGDRQKVITICVIDVHSRDVVSKMISQKVPFATCDCINIRLGQFDISDITFPTNEYCDSSKNSQWRGLICIFMKSEVTFLSQFWEQ